MIGVTNIQINFHSMGNIGNAPSIFCELRRNLLMPYTQTITLISINPIKIAEILIVVDWIEKANKKKVNSELN